MSRMKRAIGQSILRAEGPAKLRGEALYVGDVYRPGMVHARVITCPYAHARIKNFNFKNLIGIPGVVGVFTEQDLGCEGILAKDEVFYAGQPVAVIAAESEAIAEDAAELIDVSYERLPAVIDPFASMMPNAPRVQTESRISADNAAFHGADVSEGEVLSSKPQNVNASVRFRNGDTEFSLNSSDIVIEHKFEISSLYQGYMEPRGCVAEATSDAITIWTATQGIFSTRKYVANYLGVPEDMIKIIPMTVGGAFGAKFGSFEPLIAKMSQLLQRPVRLILDRLQDMVTSRPAPGCNIALRLGVSKIGKLKALQSRIIFDSGAEPGAPVGLAALLLGSTYRIPNYDLLSLEVLTHKQPVGAYRAPGAPQAYFALESAMDEAAHKLNLDPLEFRRMNAVESGDLRPDGKPWPTIGLAEVLNVVADHPMWKQRTPKQDEGWGLAVGGWMGGVEPASAICCIESDGTITVQVGAVDLTGTTSAFQAITAETLGITPKKVKIVFGDTAHAPYSGAASGSKTTYTVGTAVQQAAIDARKQLIELAANILEVSSRDVELFDNRIQVKGVPSISMSIGEIASQATGLKNKINKIIGKGQCTLSEQAPAFAVHVARVKVDRATGMTTLISYLAAQDVGCAIVPSEIEGQIRGGIAQGIGRAFYETFLHDSEGTLVTSTLSDYCLPLAIDVPQVETVLVQVPSDTGPYGARVVGEPPTIPVAPAIANAIFDAIDVRITKTPFRPEVVFEGIMAKSANVSTK